MKKDDFWSIDKLIPSIHSSSAFQKKEVAGIRIREIEDSPPATVFGPRIFPKNSKVIREYRLSEATYPTSSLKVKMTDPEEVKSAPFVPCTLFSPTYLSLKQVEKAYFHYLLNCIRKQEEVPVSFAYLKLYCCFCVQEGFDRDTLSRFLWVWETYRSTFPLLDKLFADALVDWHLFTRKPLPFSSLSQVITNPKISARPFLFDLYLFDYLLSEEHKIDGKELNFILRTLTGEGFRKSKAYRQNPRFAALTEEAILRAVEMGLFTLPRLNSAIFNLQIPSQVRIERRLFAELPREEVPDVKISLVCTPLLHDENIRSRFDEIIRYLENRIRKILKMKNSLSRVHVSQEHQAFLDSILAKYEYLTPVVEEETVQDTPKERVKREINVDFNLAAQIEEDSWTVTEALTRDFLEPGGETVVIGGEDDAFDEKYADALAPREELTQNDLDNDLWEFASLLTEAEDTFMQYMTNDAKKEAVQFCLANGTFPETMISSCNQKAQDSIGDTLFDAEGNLYLEYKTSLKDVFPPVKGEK